MGLFLSKQAVKTLTFREWVVIKMDILCTPLTPRYYYLLFLIIIFSGKFLVFSDEYFEELPEYKKLKLNDYVLITGLLPEFSYDIFENKFSLQISLNGIISNSFALYENQLNKEIFKNNYFEKKALKIEAEKKTALLEKKLLEKELQKILDEIVSLEREISSLEGLITDQGELLKISLEIYNYHQKEFNDGAITTIEFLKYKKDYLAIVFKHEELIYQKELLENEKRSKRSQIPDSQ